MLGMLPFTRRQGKKLVRTETGTELVLHSAPTQTLEGKNMRERVDDVKPIGPTKLLKFNRFENFPSAACIPAVGLTDWTGVRGDVHVRRDGRMYKSVQGIVSGLVPIKPVDKEPEELYITKVDYKSMPSLGELKWLLSRLFNQYKQEVVVLVGVTDAGKWIYVVPRQEGSTGGVTWDDPSAVQWLVRRGRWVGTIHSHPRMCAEPSLTDTTNWARPHNDGLHMILGRGGMLTVTACLQGHQTKVMELGLEGIRERKCRWHRSGDLPMTDLLGTPAPSTVTVSKRSESKSTRLRRMARSAAGKKPLDHIPATDLGWECVENGFIQLPDGMEPIMLVDEMGIRYVGTMAEAASIMHGTPWDHRSKCKVVLLEEVDAGGVYADGEGVASE